MAARPPDVIAVDWSGARDHEEHTLRLAAVADGVVRRVVPATRRGAGDVLIDAASRNPALVVGLDFSFSLPEWWLDACGLGEPAELWSDAERLEGWLARCDAPFWGRPGRRRPGPADGPLAGPGGSAGDPLRLTERCAPGRPASVFQIGGAGAVGTASLRGMPTLARLRAAGFAVWPMDPWRPPVVAEVWPRLAIGRLVKRDRAQRQSWAATNRTRLAAGTRPAVAASPDSLDAAAAALWLATWATGAGPALLPSSEARIRREGWIAGVPPAPLSRRRNLSAPSVGDNEP